MRKLLFLLLLAVAPAAMAQGYQPIRANCPNCVLTQGSLSLSGTLTVTGMLQANGGIKTIGLEVTNGTVTANNLLSYNAAAFLIAGQQLDGASAVGVKLGSQRNFTTTGAHIVDFQNNMTGGGTSMAYVDITGAPGFAAASGNGTATFGTWSIFASGTLAATTSYGSFKAAGTTANLALRQVTCTHGTAGVGTNGTLAIRNVTDSTTLCSGSYTCTTAANTPTAIFDCAASPTAGKVYALQFTTGCGTTQVSNLNCSVEMTH
jgi:hypothetical protein